MNFFRKLFGKGKDDVSKRVDQPDVYHVRDDAARMNQAMEKARLTLNYFKKSLQKPSAGQAYFSLKARIVDGKETEHIWLTDVSFDDVDIFYGTIGNAPLTIKNVSLGKAVGVGREDVSDWMIVENGRLIGGYTIRCIREGLTEKALKDFDAQLSFYVDDGIDYFDHDFTTPEGAILCIEDAYDEQDLDRTLACKDFEAEARLMLSQVKTMEKLAMKPEIIEETAKALKLSFIKFIDEQGFPSFTNVKRSFPEREFVHDDLCIITEICHYPDNTKSVERLYVARKNGEWRVLNPAD